MTKRQIQKIQCRVRRGVNKLYGSYLTSVLHSMKPHDRAGEIDQALATVSPSRLRPSATPRACHPVTAHREMKLRADLSSARLRERLWRVQHLQLDPCATGFP
jgi:hypothetical protein